MQSACTLCLQTTRNSARSVLLVMVMVKVEVALFRPVSRVAHTVSSCCPAFPSGNFF